MCWCSRQERLYRLNVVSVAGCLGYDVLVERSRKRKDYFTFQLLVV